MGVVVMFVSSGCTHCVDCRSIFQEMNVRVEEINLTEYPKLRDVMVKKTLKKTVPQIFFNDTFIGGAAELHKHLQEGTLNALLLLLQAEPDVNLEKEFGFSESLRVQSLKSGLSTHFLLEKNLDDLFYKLKDKQLGLKVSIRRSLKKFKTFRNCFKSSQLLAWLQENGYSGTSAIEVSERLVETGYVYRLNSSIRSFTASNSIYRFYCDIDKYTLNMKLKYSGPSRPGNLAAADLNSILLKLSDKYISRSGRGINYEAIRASQEFRDFINKVTELQSVNLALLSKEESFAFFINIYNALVIHANCTIGPPTSAWQRNKFFNRAGYNIGGYKYALNDIEHGILRANRRAPGKLGKQFKSTDPRLLYSIRDSDFDPRIHFALVCGAKSCPPIRVFSPENVYEALTWATEGFCDEEVTFNVSTKTVYASMLFNWYHKDFGKSDYDVLTWIGVHKKNAEYDELLKKYGSAVRLKYTAYNWNLNKGYEDNITSVSTTELKPTETSPRRRNSQALESTSPSQNTLEEWLTTSDPDSDEDTIENY